MTPQERTAEIARLEQELLDSLDAGCMFYESSRLEARIAQLRRAENLQKQIVNRARGFAMAGQSWLETEIDIRAEGQRAAAPSGQQARVVYECADCGLSSDKEPSVRYREIRGAPGFYYVARCNDCAKKAGTP